MTRYILVELSPDGAVRWRPVPTPGAAALAADRERWVRFVGGLAEGEGECCKAVAAAFARRVGESDEREAPR